MSKQNNKSNVKEEKKAKPEQTSEPVSQQTSEPVAPPAVAPPAPAAAPAEKKEKAPSIGAATRRIVVRVPGRTLAEVIQTLIAEGWDADKVEKQKNTIASYRTDTMATVAVAKEEGFWKQQ
jgi:hypothetical protein